MSMTEEAEKSAAKQTLAPSRKCRLSLSEISEEMCLTRQEYLPKRELEDGHRARGRRGALLLAAFLEMRMQHLEDNKELAERSVDMDALADRGSKNDGFGNLPVTSQNNPQPTQAVSVKQSYANDVSERLVYWTQKYQARKKEEIEAEARGFKWQKDSAEMPTSLMKKIVQRLEARKREADERAQAFGSFKKILKHLQVHLEHLDGLAINGLNFSAMEVDFKTLMHKVLPVAWKEIETAQNSVPQAEHAGTNDEAADADRSDIGIQQIQSDQSKTSVETTAAKQPTLNIETAEAEVSDFKI